MKALIEAKADVNHADHDGNKFINDIIHNHNREIYEKVREIYTHKALI